MQINFDNAHTADTSVVRGTVRPVFEDVISFAYSTAYGDVLERKNLELTVYDNNKFSANEVLGVTRVDLGALAKGAGGVRRLPMKAGGKPSGTLSLEVVMQPTSAVPGPQPPAGFYDPTYKPGQTTAPPVAERLFAGAPGLPTCWLRRMDPLTGRVGFENLATNTVEASLPTEPEYVVSVPPSAAGALGLALEPNFSGLSRHGWRSGRRDSGFDCGAVVREVRPGGFAATDPRIRPGHHVVGINGSSTLSMTFDETVALLKAAPRPCVLRLADPYAVPHALAAAVASPSAPPEALAPGPAVAVGPKLRLTGVPPEVLVGSAAAPGGAGMPGEAGRTLELALEAMARLNGPAPSVRAATGAAPHGSDDASVEADTATWHRAVTDPALLRALTAAATGDPADVLPRAVRSAGGRALVAFDARRVACGGGAPARAGAAPTPGGPPAGPGGLPPKRPPPRGPPGAGAGAAAAAAAPPSGGGDGDEEEEEGGGGSSSATPATSEGAARAALSALATLVGCDDGSLARGDAPALTPGPRDYLYGTVLGYGDVGLLRRALDAINARSAAPGLGGPSYAGAATHVVEAIMRTYGLRAGATSSLGGGAGLDVSTLLTLQTALRKAEFQPAMVDAPPIVAALVGEFPHQDGAGFLRVLAHAVTSVGAMTSATVSRARTGEGATYYVVGSESAWEPPPACAVAMDALVAADKASRLLDDAAVIPASAANARLLYDLVAAAAAHAEDTYVVGVLLSCLAKLTAHPANAASVVSQGLLATLENLAARHPSDTRVCEVVPLILFNVGRDLEASDALIDAGGVPRVVAIARALMSHVSSSTGSPAGWVPSGREEECGEVVVLEGQDRYARERNAVRPRVVRTCVNVLINLACARRPLASNSGMMPVDVIVSAGGVALLGDILLAHLSDSVVVTAVLNAAANVAFKNSGVQLAIGERMMDAVLLAGWQFAGDGQLLSMALRTIGNLTNQDANIYRALGLGVVRMIASAMSLPVNAGNSGLLSLAASVLSNVASVEPCDEATAGRYHAVYAQGVATRAAHPSAALRPSPADAAAHARLSSAAATPVWCFAHHLVNDEGASAALISAMTRNSTDAGLVEACLRTLLCVAAGNEDAAGELVARHDVVARTLTVLRACDFDPALQLAGAQLLQALASNSQPAVAAAVVGSDAALTLCSAAEAHKGPLLAALSSAVTALNALPAGAPPASVLGVLGAALADGTPRSCVGLLTRVLDTLQLLASPRAVKAIAEMNTIPVSLSVLSSGLSLLHMAGKRGVEAGAAGSDPTLASVSALVASACLALSNWSQAPLPHYAAASAAVTSASIAVEAGQALRSSLLGSERTYAGIARLLELCVSGTGQQGDPARPAVPLKPVRALVDLVSSLVLTSPVLPGRAPPGYTCAATARLAADPGACAGLVRAGAVRHLGSLLLACATLTVHAAASGAALDANTLTARMLAGQLVALLDVVAVASGGTPAGAVDPSTGADPAALGAGVCAAAQAAFNGAVATYAHTPSGDPVPSPCKLVDLGGLAAKAAEHMNARAAAAGAGTFLSDPASSGSFLAEVDAANLFTYSITRARQAMMHAAAAAASAALQPQAARPTPPGGLPAARGAGAAAAAAAVVAAKPLKDVVGIKLANGFPCTAWIDGKPAEALARASEDCTKLTVFDGKVKAVRGQDPPTLATLRASSFGVARVGVPIKGKKPKPAGMFGKAANPKRTVCCDNDEDTLLQLECPDEAEAGNLATAVMNMLRAGKSTFALF